MMTMMVMMMSERTIVLVCLYWLRVPERVQYEIVLLVLLCKVLHGLNYVSDLPGSNANLSVLLYHQPSGNAFCQVDNCRKPGFFSCWTTVLELGRRDTFRWRLKIYLFTKFFLWLLHRLDSI